MAADLGNILKDLPLECDLNEEKFQDLLKSDGVRIERIVSKGQSSPPDFWYNQEEHEFVILLQGSARLQIEGRDDEIELKIGGWTFLPAHCKHRVTWTDTETLTVWLAVFWSPNVKPAD